MRKAGGPLVGSAAGSVCSSPQMDLQECQEMRPKSCSRSQEKSSVYAAFSLPPIDGTAPSVQKKHPGSAMKKKVLRKQDNMPLLPNKPIIHGDGSFPCISSVTSQTATGAKRREKMPRGHGQKDRAFSDPQQSLQEALSMLGSDDWELKEKGLFNIPRLAESHPEVLLSRLHEICLAVTSEVTNLRSKVSCSAVVTLGELFALLKKDMDSELDEVAPVLLHMVHNSPEFIQKAACQSLGMMVENVTPARAMTVLMDRGVKSRYTQARKCAAELLLSLVEKMGVTKLAGTPRAERLAQVAGKLAQDRHQDTRHYGQEMVKMLLNNQKFKKFLEQSLSKHDLEDILTRIKKKGLENQKGECPSVKEPVKERKDGLKEPQATLPSSKRVKPAPAVEGRESLQKLYHLLEAKGFQARMEGVGLLLDLCKTSPQLISSNIVQIFDYFLLRINDTHKKVKQKALEVLAEMTGLLEDALNPVMVRLVEGITKNLNSKDPGVHAAAVNALDRSVAHLDEVSLMKELSHQWSQLSGEALLEVTERITDLVEWVYARNPEVVQRYALPVLWSCLENKALPVRSANVCAVVTKLACALCEVMGTQLIRCAESKPPHVQENLSSLLGLTGYSLAKRFSLASPFMLLPFKLLLRTPKCSLSTKIGKMCHGEVETGIPGNGWDEESRKKEELTLERKGSKTSLLCSTEGEMKKGSLGLPLIRMDAPGSSIRSQEKTLEHAGLTGYPLAKKFSLYVSDVPVRRKSLSPVQKSCLSLKIRKRLPTDRSVFEE
ncbi:TOG array regulator of axonemal microtubules protein 2-like [Serinus canaria]|uniref:TOG array regulator of axonemal microtubules protein 2-like n=1 Tax=Serinus canaria TaxID=9135 RepID=UPI0021CD05B1|nr:TOG array regulator of axonemal microtubules protein 2-like [Serinus canaria]